VYIADDGLALLIRAVIKDGLGDCTDGEVHKFKQMYSPKNLDAPIDRVIKGISKSRLDWAMQQVCRTLELKK
jgi:hypothetical protein